MPYPSVIRSSDDARASYLINQNSDQCSLVHCQFAIVGSMSPYFNGQSFSTSLLACSDFITSWQDYVLQRSEKFSLLISYAM